jgi:hypothetical protein
MEALRPMSDSYFKKDLDISRCGLFYVLLIALTHRAALTVRSGRIVFSPGLTEVFVAFAAHRLFAVFHFLFTLRNLARKIRARLWR